MQKYLFIDRDGTLIVEPESKQIDRIDQIQLLPHVIPSLLELQNSGYRLVMVSNQDGLGSDSFPLENFTVVQEFLLEMFQSQGVHFEDVRICPHLKDDHCPCRKPRPGLLLDFITKMDTSKSFVIGDRETDLELAEVLGINGMRISQTLQDDWRRISKIILDQSRSSTVQRKTTETTISCSINLDQTADSQIETGIYFFNHMLQQLAKHAGIYIQLNVVGDLHIDDHHTIEDTALVLGQAFKRALGDKVGLARYGFLLPMDESLATVAIDLAGRAYLKFNGTFYRERISDFSTEMVKHFFKSFSDSLQATIHISIEGENTHHMIEAIFKGVGRALRQAVKKVDTTLPTTKGVL